MNLKKRIVCFSLLLALFCPIFASCAPSVAPVSVTEEESVSKAETKEEKAEKKTEISYPCQIDPDFRDKDLKYGNLSASALDSLPIASEEMTAMERRKLCLDYFQMQLTFRWQGNLDVTDYQSTYAKTVKDRALLTANLYAGIPYQSGGNGNLYRWLEYYDEATGIFDLQRAFSENGGYGEGGDLEDLKKDDAGNITYKRYRSMKTFFNACSSGAGWGWARVVNSADFGATMDYNVHGGFIPVGCYTYDNMETLDKFGTVTEGNPSGLDVDDVIEEMGENKLYECYALMRPADCLLSGGHTMMVRNVKIALKADGTVNPQRSCVYILDQGEAWSKRTKLDGKKFYRQGDVDRLFTFAELKDDGYLPFTFAELLDENDPFDKPHLDFYKKHVANRNYLGEKYAQTALSPEDLKVVCGSGVEKATVFLTGKPASLKELEGLAVGSNYPLSDVFVRVKGADGSVMLENVYHVKGNSTRVALLNSPLSNGKTDANGNRPSVMTGVAGAVAKGGTLEIAVRVSTGELLLIENLNI